MVKAAVERISLRAKQKLRRFCWKLKGTQSNLGMKTSSFLSNSLEELRADEGQHVLQKFEEGRLQQNHFKGLVNGGDQPGIRIVFFLLLFVFFLGLPFFFYSHFPLKKGKLFKHM